jgi:hypothetical protein
MHSNTIAIIDHRLFVPAFNQARMFAR